MGLGLAVTARTAATVACLVLIPVIARLYPFPLSNDFYAGLIKQPWLPAEAITLSSGQEFIGYVLSDNGAWVVVLDDGSRAIHHYRATQVASQEICQITPTPRTQPLIPLFPAHLHSPTRTLLCASLLTGRPSPDRPGPATHAGGQPAGERAVADVRSAALSFSGRVAR